ncbi:hypothetical protein BOO69_14910 [Sulfitobacter alexandrii]|uniref:HTH araC/xylS-type domain-containing protein n=1 Tax=Sulfitobacter alexandrii TaxID=1917485 RepID=A0A1J0WK79_9RHOB|nr:AraC family transcriptional regulator [Sulfitobacter alexandrii]APE44558.1 hypothetical protein BOO69_14910 [Sulfitobacter alexandrii]
MSYRHDFTGHTTNLRPIAPVEWRQLEHVLLAHWQTAGSSGATGHYVSANPRLSIFFNDMSSVSAISEAAPRKLARAIFVPAGMTLDTSFSKPLTFAHLDIHIDHAWAVRFLSAGVTRQRAVEILDRPVDRSDITEIEPMARALVGEIRDPRRHDLFASSLATCLLSGVLDIGTAEPDPGNARLTAAQMRKVARRFETGGGRRLSLSEMAQTVGLSESWFSQVFRNTTGKTPHQWQLENRVGQARDLLVGSDLSVADIADRLGFSDQSHLTRTFRRHVGETPASWRRRNR